MIVPLGERGGTTGVIREGMESVPNYRYSRRCAYIHTADVLLSLVPLPLRVLAALVLARFTAFSCVRLDLAPQIC